MMGTQRPLVRIAFLLVMALGLTGAGGDAMGQEKAPSSSPAAKTGGSIHSDNSLAQQLHAGRLPKGAPVEEYKDFILVGSWFKKAKNKSFFRTVKKGIDMLERLPPAMVDRAHLIKHIVYLPPSPERGKVGHLANIVGVFTHENDETPGYLAIYKDMRFSAPYLIAASIVGNSHHAADHEEIRYLTRRLKGGNDDETDHQARLARIKAKVDQSDKKAFLAQKCVIMRESLEIYRIFKIDPKHAKTLLRELRNRNCPS
ncbi:hypothetical protein [Magnetospira sp. QH-2]|uniref:hypothetical protein n=1 Tax=Magnetospira sp. (strain QH-2) TaxID=1288970 RepID=UPI0003E813B0|nr:hypothetical protein [Magnetospira sp. QH-2]CCQ73518.1 Exported protein of unknown function [Magnetospira sp. QH-2]